MCGIFCMLCADQVQATDFHSKHIAKLINNRGPDSSRLIYKQGALFHGAVLWQQGDEVRQQPVESNEVVLLFNGDLYMEFEGRSDTEYLLELITSAQNEDELMGVFKRLTGPFSIICHFQSRIYFARDSLGRNSLIIGKHEDSIFLSSVVDPAGDAVNAIELPPLGVFSADISTNEIRLFPYQHLDTHQHNLTQLELLKQIVEVNVKHQINPDWMLANSIVPNYSFADKCNDINDDLFETLIRDPVINDTCETFLKLLSKSVKDRVRRTPKACKDCVRSKLESCKHCRVGILFSGGVDCSMLSVIAHKYIDPKLPIDLMNVSFEKVSYNGKKTEINWNVPDRITGLDTLKELRELCPERSWNFVEINVSRDELGGQLKKLSNLVFPLDSILDESIGAALYFASRGVGCVDEAPYSSPCRVILIGSGADELFGGYTRHRNAFKRSTPDRDLLLEELNLDWARLPSRNLARDDRVIADNGITVRAPFIEENFVNFVQKLKPLQRCFPALPEGVGDKLLLRLCAYKLGLKNCSKFRKRALQFGSRIADKRQSAKDKSTLLTNGSK